jgi:hypothetical protein
LAQVRADRPPPQNGNPGPQSRRDGDLSDRARDGDRAHGPQVADREVHTDAEHEQNQPDLGQLRSQFGVRHEPGCERADDDPGEQIANERRQTQACRGEPSDEREGQADSDGGDQRSVVRHSGSNREQASLLSQAHSKARAAPGRDEVQRTNLAARIRFAPACPVGSRRGMSISHLMTWVSPCLGRLAVTLGDSRRHPEPW